MRTATTTSVLVLHNAPVADEQGDGGGCLESVNWVLAEVAAVEQALERLQVPHHTAAVRAFSDCPRVLAAGQEPVVINLVEGFAADAEMAAFVPALCTAFGKGCTGSGPVCLALTLDKARTKTVLGSAGLPVPQGMVVEPGAALDPAVLPPPPWIVKPARSDASEGIDSEIAVCTYPGDALERAVRTVHRDFGQPAAIEQLVGERELNVSILQRGDRLEVLPLAEIDFSAFPAGKPRIVDYAAKWLPESFEYLHTPRIIPAPVASSMAETIRKAALKAWHTLECRDYARVDFRFSADGVFHVLEINANPDISPDAGFCAALAAAGIEFDSFVDGIVANALSRLESRGMTQLLSVEEANPTGHTDIGLAHRLGPSPSIRFTGSGDRDAIVRLVQATGFFRPEEIDVASEVLDEALHAGPTGHYQSLCAVLDGRLAGWVCYGPTPCTDGTFDLYWLAVDPPFQRLGIGRALLHFAEADMRACGARLVAVDTSGSNRYGGTRQFYQRQGYREVARVPDFYALGDDKVVCVKPLGEGQWS